jgi:hypothetical protein
MVLFHYWSGVVNGRFSVIKLAEVTESRYSRAFFARLKCKGIISAVLYPDAFYSSFGNEYSLTKAVA